MAATRADGAAFVQFSKNPFPLIVAQNNSRYWEVQIPVQNRRYSGRGKPPKRLFWLHLPWILRGERPLSEGWAFERLASGRWRFENKKTGELLEGFSSK